MTRCCAPRFGHAGPGSRRAGHPGADRPGAVKARARSGEHARAGRSSWTRPAADAELGTGRAVARDGGHRHRRHYRRSWSANDELDAAFGVPAGGTNPMLRLVALVRTATRRWAAAAIGGYHDGENALADQLESALAAGHAQPRRPRLLLHGPVAAVLRHRGAAVWRVKNGAKSVPVKTLKTLPDGSELVMLHESDGMRARRRRDTGDKTAARLPDTIARLVQFTIVTRTRGGRARTSTVRLLTTLVDQDEAPGQAKSPFSMLKDGKSKSRSST